MSVNSGNVYSSINLSKYMSASLPKGKEPQLRNSYDGVAVLCNACMVAVGFRLVGLGEDHKIETPSDSSNTTPLPAEWNASSSSDYSFRYAHSQSSLQYLIKISKLGSKAVINGLAIHDDKVHTLDVTIKDFFFESPFPFTAPSDASEEDVAKSLEKNIFLSAGRLTDLGTLIKVNIIQKLAPGLRKEGYEETAPTASQAEPPRRQPVRDVEREDRPTYDPLRDDRAPQPARPYPFNDPLAAGPRRPNPTGDMPPGFDDEYDVFRPPGRGGIGGERRPVNIGERDLYPPGLGPRDPINGGPMGIGGGIGGGGMHPTFDDPMFGGRGGEGQEGFGHRPPPGARYDIVGPGDPNAPQGRQGLPGGLRGGPPNPFGGFGGNDFI